MSSLFQYFYNEHVFFNNQKNQKLMCDSYNLWGMGEIAQALVKVVYMLGKASLRCLIPKCFLLLR